MRTLVEGGTRVLDEAIGGLRDARLLLNRVGVAFLFPDDHLEYTMCTVEDTERLSREVPNGLHNTPDYSVHSFSGRSRTLALGADTSLARVALDIDTDTKKVLPGPTEFVQRRPMDQMPTELVRWMQRRWPLGTWHYIAYMRADPDDLRMHLHLHNHAFPRGLPVCEHAEIAAECDRLLAGDAYVDLDPIRNGVLRLPFSPKRQPDYGMLTTYTTDMELDGDDWDAYLGADELHLKLVAAALLTYAPSRYACRWGTGEVPWSDDGTCSPEFQQRVVRAACNELSAAWAETHSDETVVYEGRFSGSSTLGGDRGWRCFGEGPQLYVFFTVTTPTKEHKSSTKWGSYGRYCVALTRLGNDPDPENTGGPNLVVTEEDAKGFEWFRFVNTKGKKKPVSDNMRAFIVQMHL